MRLDSVVHPLPYNERFYIGCAIDSFLLVAIRICVDRIHDILSKISLVFYRMLYIAGPAFLITLSLACSEGLVAYAYFYSKGCDPIASKLIKKRDQVGRKKDHVLMEFVTIY